MLLGLDLETTGFLNQSSTDPARQPGIVQVGAVRLNIKTLDEIDTFSCLVDPEIPIWSESAIETHGIKPEDVKGQPSFFSVGLLLARYSVGCTHFFGYNGKKFDQPVLAWQLKRYGLEYSFPWPPEHVDVMELAMKMMRVGSKRGGMKFMKLTEAYEHFTGKKLDNAHDALADIRATATVLRKVYR